MNCKLCQTKIIADESNRDIQMCIFCEVNENPRGL